MTIMASHYHGFIYTTIFSNSRTKSMTTQPRYDALAALIATREWWFGASEVQGILSALVACNQGGRWAEILFAQGEIDSIAHEAFDRLSLQIEETLAADALSYQLLLPEDGTLAARAEALAAWAQGFAVAIHWLQPKLEDDARAFLADLEEIGKLDCDLDDSEENRRQLTSLEEHCRMGALLIYTENHKPQEKPA